MRRKYALIPIRPVITTFGLTKEKLAKGKPKVVFQQGSYLAEIVIDKWIYRIPGRYSTRNAAMEVAKQKIKPIDKAKARADLLAYLLAQINRRRYKK